ncbi:MAG: ribonuclease HI [Caldithrix sp.]|nr:ribonuclease HI [Caldithrix sp.]
MKKVELYTDGACSGNPGPGGYGALLRYKGKTKEISRGYRKTTNNRMELMAIIAGLETLHESCQVDIYSDSRYIVDAVNQGWVNKWQRNGWMRNKKEPAKNIDLWTRLLELFEKHQITIQWLRGHAGHAENERCDELAVRAASGKSLAEDTGFIDS